MRKLFIQEILAAPTDPAPRLIYADWLEERGDDQKTAIFRDPSLDWPKALLTRIGTEYHRVEWTDGEGDGYDEYGDSHGGGTGDGRYCGYGHDGDGEYENPVEGDGKGCGCGYGNQHGDGDGDGYSGDYGRGDGDGHGFGWLGRIRGNGVGRDHYGRKMTVLGTNPQEGSQEAE